ncbi:MAG: DUF1918 domain-containing protein [Streptosporangiales bacterium]|nr:DUF1918 domain-containing protein [Streptosporangiales bacterium]
MKAEVGDQLIIDGPGEPGRIGTIIAVPNEDGSPPYQVHWLVGEYEARVFPGTGARIESRRRPPTPQPA